MKAMKPLGEKKPCTMLAASGEGAVPLRGEAFIIESTLEPHTGGRCRLQRPWGSSSLSPFKESRTLQGAQRRHTHTETHTHKMQE